MRPCTIDMAQKEFIVISNGQCGVQLSNAVWELFCVEHGISHVGQRHPGFTDDIKFTSCFQESDSGKFVPRTLQCDLEPSVLDEIRTGAYRDLYHPESLLNAIEDGSNNYARGNYSVGRALVDKSMHQIHRLVESCHTLQGFVLINSYGGGTGSGYTNALVTALCGRYPKTTKLQVGVFPGEHLSTSIVEPYNCVFAMRTCLDFIDVCIQLDNESAYNVSLKKLNIPDPTYTNVNRMIAQVVSSLTCSLRYYSSLNADINQILTNTVPYPRLRFPTCSFAPFVNAKDVRHRSYQVKPTTRDLFTNDHNLSACDFFSGKFMAVYLQYRGACSPKEVNASLMHMKMSGRYEFVDWCPTGFKVAICNTPNVQIPASQIGQTDLSVANICNHTNGLTGAKRTGYKFDMLFSKRAFVHSYVSEGMEEDEFTEARHELNEIVCDYAAIAAQNGDDDVENNVEITDGVNEDVAEKQEEGNVDPESPSQQPENPTNEEEQQDPGYDGGHEIVEDGQNGLIEDGGQSESFPYTDEERTEAEEEEYTQYSENPNARRYSHNPHYDTDSDDG